MFQLSSSQVHGLIGTKDSMYIQNDQIFNNLVYGFQPIEGHKFGNIKLEERDGIYRQSHIKDMLNSLLLHL